MKKYVKKICESRNKFVEVIIFLCIILFLSVYSCFIYKAYVIPNAVSRTPESSLNFLNESSSQKIKFKQEDTIVQEFTGDYKGLSAIRMKFGDIDNGEYKVKLINKETKRIVQEWNVSCQEKNKEYTKLKLKKKINNAEDMEYLLEITVVDSDNGMLNISTEDIYSAGGLYINQQSMSGDLLFEIIPVKQKYVVLKYIYLIIVITMLVTLIYMYYLVQKNKNICVEKLFVLFMTVFGSIYLFILPPFSAPDEPRHYATAYHISNIILGVDDDDEMYTQCRDCDDNNMLGISPTAETYRLVVDNLGKKSENIENNSKFLIGTKIAGVPISAHLPQAIGITIARLLNLNYVSSIYLSQFFNLLFYIVLVYIAIKIIPVGKYILFTLSGLPMMLQQAASSSYDVYISGIVYLFTAYVLSFVYSDKQIKIKDIILLTFISMLFSPCKLVYCIVTFLVLLIPKSNFKRKMHNAILKVCVPLSGMIVAIICNLNAVSGSAGGTNYIEWAGEEGYTLSYLLHHIGETISIFLATYHDKFGFYVSSLIGDNLGWFNIKIPVDLTIVSVILVILSINSNEQISVRIRHKILYLGIFVCISLLLCASMLLGWTPLSYHAIEGVQGRYFLPIMPLALFCFINKSRSNSNNNKSVIIGTCVVNYLVVIRVFETILMR